MKKEQTNSNQTDITIDRDVNGVAHISGGTLNQTINIYNSDNKKLITKEEIEAQRKKDKETIFSTISKSKKVYINKDIDTILSNRIAQKSNTVLVLFFSRSTSPDMECIHKFRTTKTFILIYLHNLYNYYNAKV